MGQDNPILYAGEPYDRDTQQCYLRARRYDPQTGRFTQPDPAGGRYTYAANNPTSATDHTGL